MRQSTRTTLCVGAFLVLTAAAAYAATWDPAKPWWCYSPAGACGKWASETQYIGPTYTDCIDIGDGWKSEDYVQARCNN